MKKYSFVVSDITYEEKYFKKEPKESEEVEIKKAANKKTEDAINQETIKKLKNRYIK